VNRSVILLYLGCRTIAGSLANPTTQRRYPSSEGHSSLGKESSKRTTVMCNLAGMAVRGAPYTS
jgi:hypothetical protein